MAGICEIWGENVAAIQSAFIITAGANDVVDERHDRMPVVLNRDEERHWLQAGNTDALQARLGPFPTERLESDEVPQQVTSPAYEGPELIEPVGSDRTGPTRSGNPG